MLAGGKRKGKGGFDAFINNIVTEPSALAKKAKADKRQAKIAKKERGDNVQTGSEAAQQPMMGDAGLMALL